MREADPRQVSESLASEGITAEVFQTQPEARFKVTEETRHAGRLLARRSSRSGALSPLGYNLTVSHEHRFMWFRVAKVGTRTILGYFKEHGIAIEVNHAMGLRYPTALFDDYYKFAFVRHPLGRFVSAWRNKVVDRNYFGFAPDELTRMQTIENFARWAAQHDLADLAGSDQHLTLQTRLIDLTQIDYLGRLESFDDDFAAVCTAIGLPAMRATARNQTKDRPTEAASEELTSLVSELYRLDFQVLGY